MKSRTTIITTAVAAALVGGPAISATAAEAPPETDSSSTATATTDDDVSERAADTSRTDAPASDPTSIETNETRGPVDPVVAPVPGPAPVEAPAVKTPAAEAPAAEAPAKEAPAAEAPSPEPAAPASEPEHADDATASEKTAEPAAPDRQADHEKTDEVPSDAADGADAAEAAGAAANDTSSTPQPAAPRALAGALRASASDEHADEDEHWSDNYYNGFSCDYWYFAEDAAHTSGRTWDGWYGSPQLHILHHTLTEADGTIRMVYDRDIANYWYHVWSGDETAKTDPDGIHWGNTDAQQTVLVNGYKGGNDLAARAADARALLERAGVTMTDFPWLETIESYQWQIDHGYMTADEAAQLVAENNAASQQRYADYTAYEATQFAVWYFAGSNDGSPGGNDVMSLFFDVDPVTQHVTLSDYAMRQFDSGNGGGWANGYNSDRLATMQTAAWLIEKALSTTNVIPKPTFVPTAPVSNKDGSTSYGFTVGITGAATGTSVPVELRLAGGGTVPDGVTLVDSQGKVVTTVKAGQQVFVKVAQGIKAADLEGLQIWGSADGTELGSPHFYTGWDHNNHSYTIDDEGNWTQAQFQHWLIGLGELDRPSTAWDWATIALNADPADPTDPGTTDPTDPGTTDPTDPGTTDPTDPGTTDPTDPGTTDPTDPGTTDPTDPTSSGGTTPVDRATRTIAENTTVRTEGQGRTQLVAPAPAREATTSEAARAAGLAQTGSDATTVLWLTGAMLALGGVLVAGSRIRRRES
ncbi:hypothetical protein [Luteimicrobium subarcticum]|uniref:LPXTG-motif cell wall-anchored protein n=1 Tax=Luteimicrobium subarcticum TaxID=620910 RepID=A0A2M8W6L4_9MICO|nr:hypothetical protein [Luteimicrobium subarcticum]PJI86566.1 hypothetical protein CLV34_2484 [Luteimicrobium subarcticum]